MRFGEFAEEKKNELIIFGYRGSLTVKTTTIECRSHIKFYARIIKLRKRADSWSRTWFVSYELRSHKTLFVSMSNPKRDRYLNSDGYERRLHIHSYRDPRCRMCFTLPNRMYSRPLRLVPFRTNKLSENRESYWVRFQHLNIANKKQ